MHELVNNSVLKLIAAQIDVILKRQANIGVDDSLEANRVLPMASTHVAVIVGCQFKHPFQQMNMSL